METGHPQGGHATFPISSFIPRMLELYQNPDTRVQATEWERLLIQAPLTEAAERDAIAGPVLRFLVENPYVAGRVWSMFDAFFGWTVYEKAYLRLPKESLDIVRHETNTTFSLSYNATIPEASEPKYLSYKRSLRDAAIDDRRDDVRRYYELASHLCAQDSELYALAFRYYDGLNHWEQTSVMIGYAWEALTQLLSMCVDFYDYEIKRPEYLKKRGFDTEALDAYRQLAKKYPYRLEIPYKRMECLYSLHDKAGASAERMQILAMFPRVRKELEKRRINAGNPIEIDSLIAENASIIEEINARFPAMPLPDENTRGGKIILITAVLAVVIVAILLVIFLPGMLGSSKSDGHFGPDSAILENQPATVDDATIDFAENLQLRFPNDLYSHDIDYSGDGYLVLTLTSLQSVDASVRERILSDVAGFVRNRRSTSSADYTTACWRVTFASGDGSSESYISSAEKILSGASVEDSWKKE